MFIFYSGFLQLHRAPPLASSFTNPFHHRHLPSPLHQQQSTSPTTIYHQRSLITPFPLLFKQPLQTQIHNNLIHLLSVLQVWRTKSLTAINYAPAQSPWLQSTVYLQVHNQHISKPHSRILQFKSMEPIPGRQSSTPTQTCRRSAPAQHRSLLHSETTEPVEPRSSITGAVPAAVINLSSPFLPEPRRTSAVGNPKETVAPTYLVVDSQAAALCPASFAAAVTRRCCKSSPKPRRFTNPCSPVASAGDHHHSLAPLFWR